jgi:hypothetical protein
LQATTTQLPPGAEENEYRALQSWRHNTTLVLAHPISHRFGGHGGQVFMDDYEFDANLDRLGYLLDCTRLSVARALSEYRALGCALRIDTTQILAARDRWQSLERRCHGLQRTLAELRAGNAA